MPWTPWIAIEPDDTDDTAAQTLYQKTRNPITRKISDLTRITSSTPEASELIKKLCDAVYGGANGLTVREKEITALVTSAFNGCVHWTASHTEALGRVARDKELARQVADDFTKADLSARERRIADFTVKVTRMPNACSPVDIDQLREAGLTDKDIVCLVEIIAYQNMSTRIMEALSTVD